MLNWIYSAACLLVLVFSGTAAARGVSVEITLIPNSAESWAVEYQLTAPANFLVFARGNGDYRTRTWTPGDEFIVERLGATDLVRRRDGQPFTGFAADIATFSERVSKDYIPFLRFSDGAQAVFTGQFIVGFPGEPVDDAAFIDGANNDNTLWPDSIRANFEPGYFGRMIINSRVVTEPETLLIGNGNGNYVYFGAATALETPHITAVVDSASPAWLVEVLYDSMRATFELYSARLGALEGGKPSLLTTFEALEAGRLSFTGGVIGTQMAFQLGLGADIVDTPAERAFMARFFAHEAAHLWNNGEVVNAESSEAWLHEGSAEAMAWLALAEIGFYSSDDVRGLFQEAANKCTGFLDSGPLREAARREDFQAYYTCGAVMALATHGAMREEGGDLFDFWRELLRSAQGAGVYDATDYYRQLDEVSRGPARRLYRFETGKAPRNRNAVLYILEAGNVPSALDADGDVEISALP